LKEQITKLDEQINDKNNELKSNKIEYNKILADLNKQKTKFDEQINDKNNEIESNKTEYNKALTYYKEQIM
jgi:chromosome segregation ATPase